MKTSCKIPCTLFVFMVHIDNLNRTVPGHGNIYYPFTYNQHSVGICKGYK